MTYSNENLPTFGLEEELVVVDARQMEPVCIAPECLEMLDSMLGKRFAREYKRTSIELVTGIHDCPLSLTEEAAANREEAAAIVERFDYRLLPLGVHPWAPALQMPASEDERYRMIEARMGDAVRGLGAHGVHLHIGTITDETERWRLTPRMMHLVPLHTAVSAASPFHSDRDSGQASWRGRILMQLASSLPVMAGNAQDAKRLLKSVALAGGSQGKADDWSWLRPGAGKPTIEFRSFDTMPTLDHIPWLAALTAAVVTAERRGLLPAFEAEEASPNVYTENQRNATSLGVDCQLIDPFSYDTRSVNETIDMWLRRVEPVIESHSMATALATRPEKLLATHKLMQRVASDGESAALERGLDAIAANKHGLLDVINWALDCAAKTPSMPWVQFPQLSKKEFFQ